MTPLKDWFLVRFDSDKIHLEVDPPGGTAWEEQIAWERIIRVCFKANDLFQSDEIYLFTDERPESYVIPTEAEGGSALWQEIIGRGLFDAQMAIDAATAENEMFCSPLRKPGMQADRFSLYSPRQLPELDGEEFTLTWDQDGIESIIRFGDFVVWREETGWEVYGRFEEIAVILQHKYGPRLRDVIPTPGSLYALYGDSTAANFHVAAARDSLQTGEVPATEPFYWYGLEEAVRKGNTATIKKYLAQGGDPNIKSIARGSADTLLHIAGFHRQPHIARILIAAGANVNAMDTMEKPPLVNALDDIRLPAAHPPPGKRPDPEALLPARTTELVKLLVHAGANLSGLNRPFSEVRTINRETYRAPLMLAAQHSYVDALRFLIEQGAEIEAEDHFGDTPLITALRWGKAAAAQILIDAGADIHREPYSPDGSGNTQIQMVIQSARFDSPAEKLALLRRMMEAGADVDRPNTVGDSPLLTTVRYGTDERYSIIGFGDKAGKTEWRVTRWPIWEQKMPPEQVAAIVRLLLSAGADTSTRDRDGKTARDLAQEAGLTEAAALL